MRRILITHDSESVRKELKDVIQSYFPEAIFVETKEFSKAKHLISATNFFMVVTTGWNRTADGGLGYKLIEMAKCHNFDTIGIVISANKSILQYSKSIGAWTIGLNMRNQRLILDRHKLQRCLGMIARA